MTDEPTPILAFFNYHDLTGALRRLGQQYAEMASTILLLCVPRADRERALQRLLESRDAAFLAVS